MIFILYRIEILVLIEGINFFMVKEIYCLIVNLWKVLFSDYF